MLCPVCETNNADTAAECANCGKQLATDAQLFQEVAPIAGLELTLQPPADVVAEPLIGLEQTQLIEPGLQIPNQMIPDVERTQLEQDPQAPLNWVPGNTPLDLGREADDGVRTPAPQDDGKCPWCGSPSTDAVCGTCGRRRSRYTSPVTAGEALLGSDETMLCPACFARVPASARCDECGTPFPVREL